MKAKLEGIKDWQKMLIAFVVSYIMLYALQALLSGAGWISSWGKNPTFYILPIVGFFGIYCGIDWAAEFFETNFVKKPMFLVLFLILALLAWHFALVFYMQNNVVLELKNNQNYINGQAVNFSEKCTIKALSDSGKRSDLLESYSIANCLAGEIYSDNLKSNPYLILVLSIALGWFARFLIKED